MVESATASDPGGWRADPDTEVYDLMRTRVVDAAERYVEAGGLAKVRIDEIADAAGCSRATIYRYFTDKDELIREVLIRRSRRIAATLAQLVAEIDDPAELLVQGIVRSVDQFRDDPYFESFYGPAAAGTTTRIAGGSTAIRAVVAEAMGPLFDLAETTGRLLPGVDRDRATEWIMLVTTALLTIPEPSMGTAEERAGFLRTFLVPALFA